MPAIIAKFSKIQEGEIVINFGGENFRICFIFRENKDTINLDEIYNYQIVVTTPYVILGYSEKDWIAFFNRQGIDNKKEDFEDRYQEFNSNKSKYWHNYIMDAYSNYESNCIFLTGIPDIKGSKPHELF